MLERDPVVEVEPWGEDPKLVELLEAPGATGFRALFDGFPEAVGAYGRSAMRTGGSWTSRSGYGNPSILRAFRLPAATRDRYRLLEALPRMRGSRAFDAYVRVCDSGEPWVQEVTYRGDAPPRIAFTALRDSQEWVVTVRDNGLGVDPDKASAIFDMFARDNDERDGVGIGLAVCRRIVEAHGGRIWAEAPADGGSAFRFTLPR